MDWVMFGTALFLGFLLGIGAMSTLALLYKEE
jgi:hypothetical protein